jgi:hypothetical protein
MDFLKRSLSLLGLAAMALTLSSCSGVKPMIAERPQDQTFRTELKQEVSTVSVPIEATTAELAKTLNQLIAADIYKGSTKYKGLTADIRRNGQIAVSAADNFLYLTVPISMKLNYGMFEVPPVSFKVKFRLTARITPDWRLNAEIYYTGLSDLLAEDVGIGTFSIKPRSIVEGVAQPVQKLLSDVISKAINARYPLKDRIAKVWFAAQKPVLLDKTYSAWLRITPLEAMLCPLYAQNNQVRLSLGLKTFAELVVGPEPAARPLAAMPDLKLVNAIDRNFRISLNTDLYFRDMLAIASPMLLNKEFESDGKRITIKALDVYGNGDRLVVKVETTGAYDGVFYLTGRPVFNPQTNMVSVEDVDFDVNTQNLLLQSAAWLLHGAIRGVIQEKLTMDMTPQLEQAREMARKAMSQVRLAENIFLKGSVKTIKLNDVLVQKDKITVQVYTEGETAVVFQ